MTTFDIYLTGVGGQGIGLLSEVLLRAADHAGYRVVGVDTHGLAQRGGIVISRLRLGPDARSPLIPAGAADLAVALERHEALRAIHAALSPGGTLIYYDAVWQPLPVRTGDAPAVTAEAVEAAGREAEVVVHRVFSPDLKDARMQNMALLGEIHRFDLVPDVSLPHYEAAMSDLMDGERLRQNLAVFNGNGSD